MFYLIRDIEEETPVTKKRTISFPSNLEKNDFST